MSLTPLTANLGVSSAMIETIDATLEKELRPCDVVVVQHSWNKWGSVGSRKYKSMLAQMERLQARVKRKGAKVTGNTQSVPGPEPEPEPHSRSKTPAQTLSKQIDADGNGVLSFEEFASRWSRRQLVTAGALDASVMSSMEQQ